MGSKTVDIIIPCYNGAKFLSQTIESALEQTYSPVKILVIDDGSTDASAEIVKSYGDRVAYFFKENGGQASARNAGIRRTEGDYVCLLDADDIILPEMIQVMVDYLESHPEVDMCHSKTLVFNNLNVMHPYAENWRPFLFRDCYLEPLSVICAIHVSSALMRRKVFEKFGEFPEDRTIQGCEDWYFWLQSVLQGAVIKYLPNVYSLYRQHSVSTTSEMRNIALHESELIRRAVDLFRLHGITEDRKWRVLSYGMKSIALRWLALREIARFTSLLELSRSIRPGKQPDPIDAVFGDAARIPVAVLYLYLCRAFIELDLSDLAAVMFLKCGKWGRIKSLQEESVQAGAKEVFEFVVEAMNAFAAEQRPKSTDKLFFAEDDENKFCDTRNTPTFPETLWKTVPNQASFWGHVEHQLGLLSKSEGALDDAETRFRQSIQLNPNYCHSRLELTRILAQKGCYRQAARELGQAVTVEPECVISYAVDRVCGLAENHPTTMGNVLTRFRRSRTYQMIARIIRGAAGRVIKSLVDRRTA